MSAPKAKRIAREFLHRVPASADDVFPLLCPVREYDWIEPWSCELVYSESGLAENNCIFRTAFTEAGEIWTVSRHDPASHAIEFVIVSPGSHVEKLDIAVTDAGVGESEVRWNRTYTSLSKTGDARLDEITGEPLAGRMAMLQEMLAHYLRTGERLPVMSPSARR